MDWYNLIGRMIDTHKPIPEVEIQAVITAQTVVVHVVVRGGIEPFENRMLHQGREQHDSHFEQLYNPDFFALKVNKKVYSRIQ